jgi:hypothetical protein
MILAVQFLGISDGDTSVEPTERAIITVLLDDTYSHPATGLCYRLGEVTSEVFIGTQANLLLNYGRFPWSAVPCSARSFLSRR